MNAADSRLRAEALLRRRRVVTAADVASELAGADASELRRLVLRKLRADDLEETEVAPLALIAAHAGLGPARRDVERIAADERRPQLAREAARTMLGPR